MVYVRKLQELAFPTRYFNSAIFSATDHKVVLRTVLRAILVLKDKELVWYRVYYDVIHVATLGNAG
jgi:hypothetical protein